MKVLLVRKTTNLEQHGDAVKRNVGSKSTHVGLLERSHEQHYECLHEVRNQLDAIGIPYSEIERSTRSPSVKYSAIVTVGGDGTLLTASHRVEDARIPIVGIRSSNASVGYLCAGDRSNVEDLLRRLKEGKLEFKPRARLKAEVIYSDDREPKISYPILNDFLYANANPASTTRYRISYKGSQENHKSSGIWVATATGSTAAISASGGQELPPDDPRYQFCVRELYQSGETMEIKSGFFEPEVEEFEVENHCKKAILALDGERGILKLGFGDRIRFLKASPINIASPIS